MKICVGKALTTSAPSQASTVPKERRLVEFVCDFYVPEVHAGIVDYARKAGWSLLDTTVYAPSTLLKYSEDSAGIVAIVSQPELAEWLKMRKRPVVRLLCTMHGSDFPAVEPDGYAIGARGAEHLLTLGLPTFVFYRAAETEETRKMWAGFSSTIEAAGHQSHLLDFSASLPSPPDYATPRSLRWEFLHREMKKLPRPLAVMAEDDRFANDLIEAAALGGWWIPEDLAILAADNRELILGKFPVPISSVDSNLRGIGWTGAELLDRIMNGEPPPKDPIRVSPGLVIARRSTATFSCDNPAVSAAVTFLRAHYREAIQVADVARAAGVSSRSIQTSFRDIVGCTISDELSRLRIEHAARLLRETDLKLESVAHEAGLTSAKYLCEVFRNAFRSTPTEFRELERKLAMGSRAQRTGAA